MSCGKCGNNGCLCPVSLGLALAVTSTLALFVWVLVAAYQGEMGISWSEAGMKMLGVFIKSFLFGFVVALVYDLIVMRCKGICCKKSKDAACCPSDGKVNGKK
jgi:hypothetical protein